ncbi:MAG TPA: SRPBCC family protein [Conexibacter sp.]|jgi:carbon monoxide dehydrogenase subunit G
MIVAGSTTLALTPARLRALLEDPEQLSAALPGVDGFTWSERPGEGPFEATIRPALALGEIPLRTVWERQSGAEDELRYRVEGRTDEHRVAFDVVLRITPAANGAAGEAAATVAWELDCHVTGTLRSAGQRVIAPIVDRQVRTVLAAAERAGAAS